MADTESTGEAGADIADFDIGSVIAKYESALMGGEAAEASTDAGTDAGTGQEDTAQDEGTAQTDAAAQADTQATGEDPSSESDDKDEADLRRAKQLNTLARREAALAEKESAVDRLVSEQVDAAREQIRSELRAAFARNPARFASEVGIPKERLGQYATLLWGAELGDEAPAEVRTKLAQLELDARMEDLEKGLKKPKDQGKQEHSPEFVANVAFTDREIKGLVSDPPGDMPFLAGEIEDDPEVAYQALCQVAAPMIQQGRWPSARECARALEDQLRSSYERLSKRVKRADSKSAEEAKPSKKSAKKAPPTSLSDADATTRTDRKAEGLLDDEEYIRRAEAVAKKHGLVVSR